MLGDKKESAYQRRVEKLCRSIERRRLLREDLKNEIEIDNNLKTHLENLIENPLYDARCGNV